MGLKHIEQELKATKGLKLNPRHRQLADEFLANGMMPTEAARTMKYASPTMAASKILGRPEVKAYLKRKLAQIAEDQWLRREQLLAKMRRLNDFNLMAVSRSADGTSVIVDEEHYDEVAREIGDCVTKVKVKETMGEGGEVESRSIEIELMSKDRMFDRECKYLGILDLEGNPLVNVNVGGAPNWDELAAGVPIGDTVEGRLALPLPDDDEEEPIDE